MCKLKHTLCFIGHVKTLVKKTQQKVKCGNDNGSALGMTLTKYKCER